MFFFFGFYFKTCLFQPLGAVTLSSAKKRKKLPELSDSDSNVPKKKPEEVPTKKRKKMTEKVLSELSDSDSNVPEKKPEDVPAKNYFIGSGEKVVPISDVFKNRILDIEAFKQDKPEIYKALIYIMESDMKVMKAQVTDLLKTLRNLKNVISSLFDREVGIVKIWHIRLYVK